MFGVLGRLGQLPQYFFGEQTSPASQADKKAADQAEQKRASGGWCDALSAKYEALKQRITDPDTLMNLYDIYNAAIATFVGYHYITTPTARASEYLLDFACHGLNACVKRDSHSLLKGAALLSNVPRMLQIHTNCFETNCLAPSTTISPTLNKVDFELNHVLNLGVTTGLMVNDVINDQVARRMKEKEAAAAAPTTPTHSHHPHHHKRAGGTES